MATATCVPPWDATVPTRDEIIDDAIEIVRVQHAVRHAVNFWEDEHGEELYRSLNPNQDPGDCRVCVEGAIFLAQVRRGLRPDSEGFSFCVGLDRAGKTLVDIEDDDQVVIAALEALRRPYTIPYTG